MENQTLFSSKDKSKILQCCPLQFLFGALYSQNCLLFNTFLYATVGTLERFIKQTDHHNGIFAVQVFIHT